MPFSALTVLLGNLNTEPPQFYGNLPSVIIILVMQRIIPVSSVAVSVAAQKIFNLPLLILSVTADPDAKVHQNRKGSRLLFVRLDTGKHEIL